MKLFEHSFVKETTQRKDFNIPKIDGVDGKIFSAMTQENVSMMERVKQEERRATASEEMERRRAISAEQAINEMIVDSEKWVPAFLTIKTKEDDKYLSRLILEVGGSEIEFKLDECSIGRCTAFDIYGELVFIELIENKIALLRSKYNNEASPCFISFAGAYYDETMESKLRKIKEELVSLDNRISKLENS